MIDRMKKLKTETMSLLKDLDVKFKNNSKNEICG